MKNFFFLIILILFQNCSFDQKTGIWKNENLIDEENNVFKEFEKKYRLLIRYLKKQ